MPRDIDINGRLVGASHRPYIVAEMSANHNGDLSRAKEIVLEAKIAGADAVKLQSYTADSLTLDMRSPEFMITSGLWAGQNLYDLYKSSAMPWEWHKPLFDYGKELGITIFSSPFDFSAVDMLAELGAPAYKIASFELLDTPLIEYAAKQGKPLIMSTGMASIEEVDDAVKAARRGGCEEILLLHCVSGYPAQHDEYNLAMIAEYGKEFHLNIGLSDHTVQNTTAIAGVALGACFIEKHVTLDRSGGGADDSFSIEPEELADLVGQSKMAWAAIGKASNGLKKSEKDNVKFRRSLYVVEDIKAGETFTNFNLRSVRPGYGLAPKYYENVLTKQAAKFIAAGSPLTQDLVRGFEL
ncbi:pseudaminic acid synthase [Pseudomonadales bacterium]|nr:pseudaminic acid synthase [Pseudomonadales bacterium]